LERDELPCRSAHPHAFVLIFFSPLAPLSFFSCPVSSSPPRARQQDIPQAAAQDEIRVPITFLPALVASPLLFNFPFSYTFGLIFLDNAYQPKPPPCSTHTPSFSTYHSLSFAVCTLSVQSTSPAPPGRPTIQNLDLAESCI
jgi:hypothetical protein